MDKGYAAWAARWRVPLGFLLGVAYLVFSQPTVRVLAAGGLIAFLGLSLRAYAAGFLEKDRKLATGGPYRYTRNPLYLGSFFMGCGFAVAGRGWGLGLAFALFFILIYWPVLRREEDSLRRHFGEAYDHYAKAVSLFIPTRSGPRPAGESFRWEQYRKNREYQAAIGYFAGIVFLILKMALR
jgi:protein-S-isoprenylcysteine O-methyltransferase Ste14